jgi:hypothetical protein
MKSILSSITFSTALVSLFLFPNVWDSHASTHFGDRLKPDIELTQPSHIRRPIPTSEMFVDSSGFYQGFRYEFQTRDSALLVNVSIDRVTARSPHCRLTTR